MDYQTQRTNLIEWIKNQLIGFDYKDNILAGIAPLDRFFTGILFPVSHGENEPDDDTDVELENEDDETAQPVKKEKRYIPPSSAGFSFYITDELIKLRIFYQWSL